MFRFVVAALATAVVAGAATNETAWDVAQTKCSSIFGLMKNLPANTPFVKLLKGAKSATLFCPSNAAFDKLISANLVPSSFWTDVANQELLVRLLENHVVAPGFNSSSDLVKLANSASASVKTKDDGEQLLFSLDNATASKVTVTSSTSVTANVSGGHGQTTCYATASKGCVFVVDAVLMPSNVNVPTGTAQGAINNFTVHPEYKYFSEAVAQAGIGASLGNATTSGITVFVPTNAAMLKFLKLPVNHTGAVNFTATNLKATLQYHILTETIYADQFMNKTTKNYSTLDGTALVEVEVDLHGKKSKGVTLHGAPGSSARVNVASALKTSNGVLYLVDEVLQPSSQTGRHKGLTTGAIVAIVIGAVAGLICIAALVYNFTKTRSEHTADGYGQLEP